MRILIVTPWYPSAVSAVSGIFVREQARVIGWQHEVLVIAAPLIGWRSRLRAGGWPRPVPDEDGPPVVWSPVLTPVPRVPRLAFAWYRRQVLSTYARVARSWGRPDVIHAHVTLPAGSAALAIARGEKAPLVVTEHVSSFGRHLGTAPGRDLVREVLIEADQVVAVSPSLAAEITAFEPRARPTVVPNVVRTDLYHPRSPVDVATSPSLGRPFRFLFVGLLVPRKGVADLLEAAVLLRSHSSEPFELVVVGDGPERASLQAMAARESLPCLFAGLLPPTEVAAWMRRVEAFVLPSYRESFGMVLAEAMASGLPVIAARSGGSEYVVDAESGVLVPSGDPAALAAAMEGVMSARQRYDPAELSAHARERFGADAFLARINDVYASVGAKTSAA